MAAAPAPATPPYRHVTGDLVNRFYLFTSDVANTNTLTIPGVSQILMVNITPDGSISAVTDATAGWSGNVITFHSSGTWKGTVQIISRT